MFMTKPKYWLRVKAGLAGWKRKKPRTMGVWDSFNGDGEETEERIWWNEKKEASDKDCERGFPSWNNHTHIQDAGPGSPPWWHLPWQVLPALAAKVLIPIPSSHPGAGAHWIALNTHFRIDRQSPEVRDRVLFISIFLAWHSALACIRHSVNDADWMHEVEDIEEKALMALLQNLSVLEVFIHIFMCLIDTHAPSVSTQTLYHFFVYLIW